MVAMTPTVAPTITPVHEEALLVVRPPDWRVALNELVDVMFEI